MKKTNRKSIWCAQDKEVEHTTPKLIFVLESGELADLKTVLRQENRNTRRTFLSLMELNEDGFRNMEFVSDFSSLFKIDMSCICKHLLSEEDREGYVFELGKLLAAGKVGEAFLLRYNTSYFILKSIKNMPPRPYLSFKMLPSDLEHLSVILPGLSKNRWVEKRSGDNKLLSAGGDNFSNQTCLHMILNTILRGNPNYVYQYDAFYCDNGGYNITEFAMKGDLSSYLDSLDEPITEEFLQDLYEQILTPLATLKADLFSFVHADFKARNVFVNLDEDKNPVYQLADFDKSSIFWKGIRFYNSGGDYRFSDIPFVPQKGPEGMYYVIESSLLPIQVYTMHSPYGFYLTYDLYTFFYSLMMEPGIWEYMSTVWQSPSEEQRDSKIFSVWKSMWYSDQFEELMTSISRRHEELSLLSGKARKDKLVIMRSIRTIANKFHSKAYKLKIDLSAVYAAFGLKIRGIKQTLTDRVLSHTSLSGKRICIEACRPSTGWRGGNKCKSNRYSKNKLVYDWDWC